MVLAAGAQAPDFTLIDHEGSEVTLSDELEEQPVVLVFFPLAFSGICTNELCELRDNLSIFDDQRVKLFGISVDSKFALSAWAEAENYSFQLLSDFWPHGGVARAYDVFDDRTGLANRATVLIGQDGAVLASFENSPREARTLDEYREALALL